MAAAAIVPFRDIARPGGAIVEVQIIESIFKKLENHSDYQKKFQEFHEHIMNGPGPLSLDIRRIIAIMASGRHACCCLMQIMQSEYRGLGGDADCLRGFHRLPPKIQQLSEINKVLAHRPWLLNERHFQNLREAWTNEEIGQAVVLLTYFHSLSTLAFSLGLINDTFFYHICGRRAEDSPKYEYPHRWTMWTIPHELDIETPKLVDNIKLIISKDYKPNDDAERDELYKDAEEDAFKVFPNPVIDKPWFSEMELRFMIDDPYYTYYDTFRLGNNSAPTFRVVDFAWSDKGAAIINRLYENVGSMLDEKFTLAYNLTYNTMDTYKNVDTTVFRTAMWNFIQCLFGIRHDDYFYRNINQLISSRLKAYLKNAVCWPERVTKADYSSIFKKAQEAEKAHVNLIIFEARLQSELLYASRALESFLDNN